MRYILHSMSMNLRRVAQYRTSFLMQTIAQLVMTLGDLWAILMLLERFGAIGHWSLYEVLFFFGAMQTAFALTEMINRGFGRFATLIRTGGLDSMLTRPRSPLLQVILSELDPRRIGTVLVGLSALVVSSRRLALVWHWLDVLLLLWAITGTVMLMMGLFMLEAVVCFFTVQSTEIINTLTYGGRQTCQYPIDIYPEWLRNLFTMVVPLTLCLQFPICRILKQPLAGVMPGNWVWLTPLAGAVFFFAMMLLWRAGLKHYRSTGS